MRDLAMAVLFLATGPDERWAQAGGASSSAAHPVETAGEDLAMLEAPIGHRQPDIGDLPPLTETGFERAGPPQSGNPPRTSGKGRESRTTPELYETPPTDIPPICRGC